MILLLLPKAVVRGTIQDDASDRLSVQAAGRVGLYDYNNNNNNDDREESMTVEELQRQASVWRVFVAANAATSALVTDSVIVVASSNTLAVTVPVPSSVTISTDTSPIAFPKVVELLQRSNADRGTASNQKPKTEPPTDQTTEDKQHTPPPPPTPCTRICRYNQNCYDGTVCIGCFRDTTHDIAHYWSSMSGSETMVVTGRCRRSVPWSWKRRKRRRYVV